MTWLTRNAVARAGLRLAVQVVLTAALSAGLLSTQCVGELGNLGNKLLGL